MVESTAQKVESLSLLDKENVQPATENLSQNETTTDTANTDLVDKETVKPIGEEPKQVSDEVDPERLEH